MATHPSTQLLTTPQPVVTRYNRLVLYAACGAVALFVCTYLLVVRDQGRHTTTTRPVPLVSSPQPLVTETPTVKPEPPPRPEPQPVVYTPPLQHESPAFPRQDNALVKLRAEERIKALRGPILVKFEGTQPASFRQDPPSRTPQVLEVPPASSQALSSLGELPSQRCRPGRAGTRPGVTPTSGASRALPARRSMPRRICSRPARPTSSTPACRSPWCSGRT